MTLLLRLRQLDHVGKHLLVEHNQVLPFLHESVDDLNVLLEDELGLISAYHDETVHHFGQQ